MRVVNDSVAPGDRVIVAATFTNNGITARTVDTAFRVFDQTVERQAVRVPASGSTTVRFEQRVGEPGSYRFSVNGRTATVEVVGDNPTPTATEAGGSVPGPISDLTMVVFVLLAGGVVLLVRQL